MHTRAPGFLRPLVAEFFKLGSRYARWSDDGLSFVFPKVELQLEFGVSAWREGPGSLSGRSPWLPPCGGRAASRCRAAGGPVCGWGTQEVGSVGGSVGGSIGEALSAAPGRLLDGVHHPVSKICLRLVSSEGPVYFPHFSCPQSWSAWLRTLDGGREKWASLAESHS